MGGAAWVPCPACPDWWCRLHGAHAHDCDCPAIEDWGAVDPYASGGPAMNEGTDRVTVAIDGGRRILGLHVCMECLGDLAVAWTAPDVNRATVLAQTTPWSGPCDLCRIAEARSRRPMGA